MMFKKRNEKHKTRKLEEIFCLKDFSAVVSQYRSAFFVCFCVFSVLVPQCLSAFFMRSVSFAEETQKICFQNQCFTIEIALTEEQRMKGLMFREDLPRDAGMFFIFDEPDIYGFWMKNTLIPLDMVWLDSDMKAVHIEEKVAPCKIENPCPVYRNHVAAKYVLELNAGTLQSLGFEVGDPFVFLDE